MNEEVLRTDKLGKCFSDVDGGVTRVLEEVTLSLNRGERVAVCGESGSGKTTLLSLLGGLDVPSQGEVYWNKRPLSVLSGKDITRKRCRFIHYIFQNYLLVEELSVVENMLLPVRVRRDKVDGKVYRKAFLWLERLGLAEKAKGSPRLLSGGERQRVAIARAFLARPEVILADEPTGNLDEKTGESVIRWFGEISREEGTALVLVTHNSRFADQMDRRYTLREGRLE